MFTQEMEKQYQDDFKQEHTKIDYLLYYDQQEKNYFRATMKLFGRSFLINTYDDDNMLLKTVRGATADYLGYRIIEITNNMLTLAISGEYIRVYYHTYLLIKQHCEAINAAYLDIMKEAADIVREMADKCINNEDIVIIFNKYIKGIPAHYFQDPSLIVQAEALIAYEYPDCGEMFLLQSDEIKRSLYARIEKIQVGSNEYQDKLILNNNKLISLYYDHKLKILFRLIQEKYDLGENVSAYVAYILLNRQVIRSNALAWADEYGEYFEHISEITLHRALKIYYGIENIDHNELDTISSFICYLMENKKFKNNDNYLLCYEEFFDRYRKVEIMHVLTTLKNSLKNNKIDLQESITISDIDLLNEIEFKQVIANIFRKQGYQTTITKDNEKKGIDITAEKDGVTLGINAQNNQRNILSAAIREVISGIKYYNFEKGLVVTKNYFTNSASLLAEANGIILWDRNILKEKIAMLAE